MKCLILLCAFAYIATVYSNPLTDEQRAHIHEDVEACITESGVDRGLLDDMKAGKSFKVTRELDCFAACIFKQNGVMNPDGTVNHNNPKDSEDAKECKKLSGKDACETAGKVMGCFAEHNLIPKI